MSERLYIIGNGFDRFHGIPSDYRDFARYLETEDPHTLRTVRQYFDIDENFWGTFEARLADFDADRVMDYAANFLVSYGADDWSDAGHHDYEYEIKQVTKALTTTLYARFQAWIATLLSPSPATAPRLRPLDTGARFLTFNYTQTLETLYGVPPAQIVHIHGQVGDPTLVLGHGWERTERFADRVHEETDTRVAGGYDLIDDYFARTFKPTDSILADQQAWFGSLADIEEIHVLGHSISDVDRPYYRRLLDAVARDRVRWIISYGDTPCREKAAMAQLGVPDALVRFVPLSTL